MSYILVISAIVWSLPPFEESMEEIIISMHIPSINQPSYGKFRFCIIAKYRIHKNKE
jgi:hypothetical protein